VGRTLVQKGYNFCTNQLIFREETWLITLHLTNLNHLNNHWHIVLTWDFSIWTSSGFAIITWNNPKRWEKPCITKGLATCQSLGLIFPCKKVLMVDHVVGGWTPDADQIGSNLPEVIRLCGFISPPPRMGAPHKLDPRHSAAHLGNCTHSLQDVFLPDLQSLLGGSPQDGRKWLVYNHHV